MATIRKARDLGAAAAFLLILGGLALLSAVLGVLGAIFEPAPRTSLLRNVVSLGGLASVGGGFIWLHFRLKEELAWARAVAVVVVTVLAIGIAVGTLLAVREMEHGAMYVLIGGVQMLSLGIGIDVLLLRSVAKNDRMR